MLIFTITALILGGLILLGLELILIPGTTLVGVVGFVLSAAGIWMTYTEFGTLTGHLTLTATALTAGLATYVSFKTGVWKRFANNEALSGPEATVLTVGMEGKTISALRPSGKAEIEGKMYEVHSQGEWVAENSAVKIIKIQKNKIIVSKT